MIIITLYVHPAGDQGLPRGRPWHEGGAGQHHQLPGQEEEGRRLQRQATLLQVRPGRRAPDLVEAASPCSLLAEWVGMLAAEANDLGQQGPCTTNGCC